MGIILNLDPLTEHFLPSRPLHREWQMRELADTLRGFEKTGPVTVVLIGPAGSGKTTIAKWILNEYFRNKHCYVNCWINRTSHSVLKKILSKLNIFFHGKESEAELLRRLSTKLSGKPYIVFLDEFDKLENFDILYRLNSANVSLVLASTNRSALLRFSGRLLSRLAVKEIWFRRYLPSQIYDILADRARLSLKQGSYNMRILKLISYSCKGDARIAITLLRKLALTADMKGKDRIDLSTFKLLKNGSFKLNS